MGRRKPLPYAAKAAVEDALIEAYHGRDTLKPLLDDKPTTREEHYRRIGLALIKIDDVISKLEEALENKNGRQ